MIRHLDHLRREWGLRHRGAVLERILIQMFEEKQEDSPLPETLEEAHSGATESEELDDQLALVLVPGGDLERLHLEHPEEEVRGRPDPTRRGGIDLPGFVQRRAREIGRGLRPPEPDQRTMTVSPARLSQDDLERLL
ncbi:MAG: hypothetical protein ACKO0M_08200, partial [Cyanobium sp.]